MDGVQFEKNLGETCHKISTHVNENIIKLKKNPKWKSSIIVFAFGSTTSTNSN
jgi:hypothetical protein